MDDDERRSDRWEAFADEFDEFIHRHGFRLGGRLISADPGHLTAALDGLFDEAARLSGADSVSLSRIENGCGTFLAGSHPSTEPWIGATWPLSDSIGFGGAGAWPQSPTHVMWSGWPP